MNTPVEIEVIWDFRNYVRKKRDHKRIRLLNFSSDYGEFSIELPNKAVEVEEGGSHKFPDVMEILLHCKKIADHGGVMGETFEDVIENEIGITINQIELEWREIRNVLCEKDDNYDWND